MLQERIFIIIIACLLDLIFGDPHWLWHPVQGMGWLIDHVETWMRKRFRIREDRDADIRKKQVAGTFTVVIVITVSLLVAAGILYGCNRIHHTLYLVVAIWMSYQMLAACSLRRESMKVCKALEAGDVEQARTAVSMIVGRDTASLTEEGIAKAAVETVAENTSDGVIAPLFYMFLFGPVGAWVYKAINTMDSMLGYKNDKYRYFGTCAARVDDVVNFIPARLSAWLMVGAAGILGMDMAGAERIHLRDRRNHASPNSAQTESACAGALGLQLAGNAYYFGKLYEKPTIGDAKRQIEPKDIRRANRLMYGTAVLMVIVGVGVLIGCGCLIKWHRY
ncbi:MAG: adenosylcobinamide-phosphate synthase CbiB [Clostridium sp.]|nr:adenosylcobinamide-phosphate synthase CbiB [Clostridium sp.]